MKISWGTGIAIFYSFFVIAMLVFVYAATKQDNSLVSDTYYEEDLSYQKKLDKMQRTNQLKHEFVLSIVISVMTAWTVPLRNSHSMS